MTILELLSDIKSELIKINKSLLDNNKTTEILSIGEKRKPATKRK